jgi:hypothetical protein
MSAFEFWLPIRCAGEPACTMFGVVEMPVRPQSGERISFMQEKGSTYEFLVEQSGLGYSRERAVSVEVEEVSHYAVRTKSGVQFKSVIQAAPFNVKSMEDARNVREFLSRQAGLSIDPYGINTLDEAR